MSLPALISLAILNLPSALELLDQSSSIGVSSGPAGDNVPYLLDPAACNEINEILIDASLMKPASPAAMAWAIMMRELRETALSTREIREARRSLRAADKYGAADSSDTDGAERPTKQFSSLNRRSSTGSDTSQQSTLLEDIYDTISMTAVDGDPVAFLANNAVGRGSVFKIITAIATEYCTPFGFEHDGKPGQNMRRVLLDLIRASVDLVDYLPPFIIATLAVLTGSERYWEALDRPAESNRAEPAAVFLRDKVLTRKLFLVAMMHFPYESVPFLELCRGLAFANNGSDEDRPAVWRILEDTDTFTCSLPSKDYQAYVPINTQAEADCIELTQSLTVSLAPESGSSLAYRSNQARRALTTFVPHSSHEIPSGTTGKLLNDSRPFVVAWNQSYSSLTYMGKVLHCASTGADMSAAPTSLLSVVNVGAIIGLITYMLSAATKNASVDRATESAQQILGMASDGMDRNQDAVSVIFDIFEKELYKSRKTTVDLESMEIMVQCVQFTFALLQVMPDRVWPFLGRSGLLGIGKDESQLRIVVATQEMVVGQYDFLVGCIRLFDSLVEDVITHIVSRKNPTKAVTRFGSVDALRAGVSQNTMERVMLSFTRTMIEVFESTMQWRFLVQEDRMEINFRLCSTFQRILKCCFDVNDNPDILQKLTSALAPAAEYIVSVFLSWSSNDVMVLPFLHILAEGTLTRTTTLPVRGLQYWTAQVRAAIELTSTLIQVNRLLQLPSSHLEDQMFKAATTLAKIYAAHESYKLPVINLFDTLVRSAADTIQQPPSLLGHLGPETSGQYLDVLSMLDQPLNNDELSLAVWKFLSAVVSKRQQWFAIFVLTGDTPRDSFKDKGKSDVATSGQSEPLLNTALDALSSIDRLEPRKALGMLEFVALAADFWPWVLGSIEKHGRFLRGISEYTAHIGAIAATSREKSYKTSADYNSIQMASLVANILSMYTHYTQQMGNQKFAKGLVPHLTYLIKNAILPPNYNASLQMNLRKNFELKFPGCKLADFKRTTIRRPPLGDSFFYDLELADRILSYEPAWAGRKGDDGFREEVRRANFNLSVVESQVVGQDPWICLLFTNTVRQNLFHSWKSLLVQLSGPLANEPKFQEIMAVAATKSLKANADHKLPEAILERLTHSRANLAFTLLQRLLEIDSTEPAVYDILSVAWDTLRMYNPDVGAALGGKDADYYRMLLKILYLTLQVHTSSPPNLNDSQSDVTNRPNTSKLATRIALEIISTILAQGFRSLTMILHDNSTLVRPSDFALLTAILRSALHIPDVTRNTTHLLNAFSDSQTARCASTLLSWSDQLATSGDPIYGELSILFLLEMSSVPSLAESLAVEAVLSHMLSTNLIGLLQSRPFGPFDQPPRMYSIWARGILPLLLNLLHAVGAPLAAEVAAALNNFPHQLDRASGVFATTSSKDANADYITSSIASEAVTLSLIVTILHTFREAGSSAAIVGSAIEEVRWDKAQVKEDVEAALQRRESLRERITATNEREEIWSRAKPAGEGAGAENKLEEKVVEEMTSVLGILDGNSE